jgi:serine/threonine-protein kinase
MSEPTGVPVSAAIGKEDEAERGARIGPYRIEGRLGAGGMGVVYRATRADDDGAPELALKVLRRAHLADDERRRRFVREARLVAALEHPGIVRVLEVGEADGVAFLAMELVSGKSLRAWIHDARRAGAMPNVADAIAIAHGIAEAVAFAHGRGVIHRDLKPDNVMVLPGLDVRILDFGLAKLREVEGGALYEAETETNLTNDGRVLGTPGYMAPEQASGKDVGFAVDVFALGAILYELLTGTRAFTGASPMDVIVSTSRDEAPAPSSKNAAVSEALDALVARCLAKTPDARPTMREVAEALARPELRVRRPARSKVARRALAVAIACAAAALLAIGASHELRAGANATDAPPARAVPTAVTDLPLPESSVPAALAKYKRAMEDMRDGIGPFDDLEAATKLDPELAAAHLRLAMRQAFMEAAQGRVHYAQAVRLRDRLSSRDRDFLAATQPMFQRDPPDPDEWRKRMEALAERYPDDAELAYELAAMRDVVGDFAGGEAAARRAVALDPRFGLALAELGQAQAYAGKLADARATLAHCLDVAPSASWCRWINEFIDDQDGRCADIEASARQRIVADPTDADAFKGLFFVLGGLLRSPAVMREALDQAVERTSDPWMKERLRLNLSVRLESLEGDFASAAAHADQLRAHVATRSDVPERASATDAAADIQREIGHPERAGAIAKEFLDRREAWQAGPVVNDYAVASDTTPDIAGFAFRAGLVSKEEHEKLLHAWRAKWGAGLRGHYREYLWVYGFTTVVETREDAAAAIAALPGYSPIPPFLPDGVIPRATIGRTLWLGGREDDGIAYLEAATKTCAAGTHPRTWMRAHVWLADAYAKRGGSGDKERACAALGVVLDRWSNAKPRSVTAEAARAKTVALGCAR